MSDMEELSKAVDVLGANARDAALHIGQQREFIKLANEVSVAFEALNKTAKVTTAGNFVVDGDAYLDLQRASKIYSRAVNAGVRVG